MPRPWFLIIACLYLFAALAVSAAPAQQAADNPSPSPISFKVIQIRDTPVIDAANPDAKDNKFGFEDGMAVKIHGVYHLIVDEMAGDPMWVKMRIAHWTSPDAIHWKRIATLKETSGKPKSETGLPYESLWGSNIAYDKKQNRWNMFYVAYDNGGASGGRIWRAISEIPGRDGVGGPYKDIGIILQPDAHSQPWEGDQGTDSFFPYQVGMRWLALYGSHESSRYAWQVGLAQASSLAGPWTRYPEGNPLPIEPIMIENPIVTRIGRLYVEVHDMDVNGPNFSRDAHNVGFSSSPDGLHWSAAGRIEVQPEGPANWSRCIRTPLGLIPEGHDEFTLLYTGEVKKGGYFAVGMVRLKIIREEKK